MMISWPRWAASTATSLRQRRRWRPLRLTSRRAICLSLFEREFFAPVRVSPKRLDREHKIFQIDRRERRPSLATANRYWTARYRQLHTAWRRGMLRRRVSGLPQFVTVRGGYFFLPTLRSLRYFAGA